MNNNIKIVSIINSFPPDSLIEFIIENYNTNENVKHIYTKKHFEWYLSKNNTNYYEFIYAELHDIILACIMLINIKNSPENLLYINFSCTHKNYRNQGLSKLLINHLNNKIYTNENIYFYTGKPFKCFKQLTLFNFIHFYKNSKLDNPYKKLNLKLVKNLNNYENSPFHKTISIYNNIISTYKLVLYKVILKDHNKIYNNYYIIDKYPYNLKINCDILSNIFDILEDCDIISFIDINFIPNKNFIYGNKYYLYYLSTGSMSHDCDNLLFNINIF